MGLQEERAKTDGAISLDKYEMDSRNHETKATRRTHKKQNPIKNGRGSKHRENGK